MTTGHSRLTPSVRAEAAVWVARLHSSSRTHAVEAGFRRWLETDARNKEAFELATKAWESGGSFRVGQLPRISHHMRRGSTSALSEHRYSVILGIILCIVSIGGVVEYIRQRSNVTTALGEQRSMTLEDGSRITLNTKTRLSVHFEESRRLIRLEEGEALFDVAKNSARPFIVEAGGRQVRAVGTEFIVRREPHLMTVTLMEGTVQVSVPSETHLISTEATFPFPGTTLTVGQRLTLADDSKPLIDQPPIDSVLAWRRGEVVLDKTPLAAAVEEMNRYSLVKLVLDDVPTNIQLSGIFRAGDSARFAEAVAETYHLRVNSGANRITLSPWQSNAQP